MGWSPGDGGGSRGGGRYSFVACFSNLILDRTSFFETRFGRRGGGRGAGRVSGGRGVIVGDLVGLVPLPKTCLPKQARALVVLVCPRWRCSATRYATADCFLCTVCFLFLLLWGWVGGRHNYSFVGVFCAAFCFSHIRLSCEYASLCFSSHSSQYTSASIAAAFS